MEARQMTLMEREPLLIHNNYATDAHATFYLGDRLELLQQIAGANDHAELIITSPPYNIGKEYEETVPLDQYIADQRMTIEACVEMLSETGSICWQVGHYIEGSGKEKEAFPLDLVLYPIFKELGLKLRNRIMWHFGHGLHDTIRFSGRHETILWFTRNVDNYTFNLDPIRVPQKYPGKRSFRGSSKGKPSGNPRGKNPSDVWDMPNVKSNHIEKTEHPCQFPVALVERLVLSMTNPNDLVIDPYLGVGSTAVAALRHERRVAGADIEERYLDIARERAKLEWEGELKTRPMNKPIHKPNPNSSVAQVPEEWKADESSGAK